MSTNRSYIFICNFAVSLCSPHALGNLTTTYGKGDDRNTSKRDEAEDYRVRQQWCEEGLPEEDRAAKMKDRENMESSSKSVTPTEETMKHFPAVKANELGRWKFRNGKCYIEAESLGFEALQLVFPDKAVALIVEKVSPILSGILPHKARDSCRVPSRHACNTSDIEIYPKRRIFSIIEQRKMAT